MSDMHTPGPWHWVNTETDEPFDFDAEWGGGGRPSLRTVAVRKKHENSTYELPDWILDAEPMQNGNDAANALLIAAAPDLLEALRGLGEAYCRAGAPLSKEERHEDRLRLIAARAAIAKATRSDK